MAAVLEMVEVVIERWQLLLLLFGMMAMCDGDAGTYAWDATETRRGVPLLYKWDKCLSPLTMMLFFPFNDLVRFIYFNSSSTKNRR